MSQVKRVFAQSEQRRRAAAVTSHVYTVREADARADNQEKLKAEHAQEKHWQSGQDARMDSWLSFTKAGGKRRLDPKLPGPVVEKRARPEGAAAGWEEEANSYKKAWK